MRRFVSVLVATALGLIVVPPAVQASPGPAIVPAVAPAAAAPLSVRAATFNVRTARATSDTRVWLQRVDDVAAEILSRNVGIVMLQELGPGRADGRKAKIGTAIRQTT